VAARGLRGRRQPRRAHMHDGQMLYDARTTWNKQAWNVQMVAGAL
jgi:hypothetical protein